MEPIPDVTVCVLCTEAGNALPDFLEALYRTADPVAIETIIIGAADAGRLSAALSATYPEVMVYEGRPGEKVPQTVNHALRLARGRYVSLWQENALVEPGCLKHLIDFLDENPVTGLAAPRVRDQQGSGIHAGSILPGLLDVMGAVPEPRLPERIEAPLEVGWLCPPGLVIRMEVVEEVGLPDPRFRSLLGYADFCRLARRAGWHLHFLPGAHVTVSPETRQRPGAAAISRTRLSERLLYIWKKWTGRGGPVY